MKYAEVVDHLRGAYAKSADLRDRMAKHEWKVAERDAFAARLIAGARVLEVGAGTGQDSAFFAERGMDVVATDLTPEMVERCAAKGLDARVADALRLPFEDSSFDAVWTMNCLLHVPSRDLAAALQEIARVVRRDGLVYIGVYGRDGSTEGIDPNDGHDPKRFFAFRSDDAMRDFASRSFDILDFHSVALSKDLHFQSFTLRRP